MDVKTTFRNLVRDQSVSICVLHYSMLLFAIYMLLYRHHGTVEILVKSFVIKVYCPVPEFKDAVFAKTGSIKSAYSNRGRGHTRLRVYSVRIRNCWKKQKNRPKSML